MKRIYLVSFFVSIFILLTGLNKIFAQGTGVDLEYPVNNQNVYVGTLYTSTDAAGNIHVFFDMSPTVNDNTYGTNTIGWGGPNKHKFSDLVGSDESEFQFKDKNGNVVLDFQLDYISQSNQFPSGYGSLGATGGDGKIIKGSASNILSYNTSLSRNFNQFGYVLTTNSPATDNNYTPNPSYPNWIFDVQYEVTVSKNAFGSAGFGSVAIIKMHNSPSKIKVDGIPTPTFGSIGDFVWNDSNKNGIQNSGEPGIPNVIVNLYNCITDSLLATTTTDANGKYLFSPLTHGDYYVKFGIPNDYTVSPQNQGSDTALDSNPDNNGKTACITLGVSENNLTIDAGMYPTPPPVGSIGDFVWNDTNKNGIQDSGEPGIPNIVVLLFDCNTNKLIASTTTNSNGKYLFSNLSAGSYYVQFVLPNGYTFSPALQGSDRTVDSNPDPTSGKTVCVDLSAGENNLTIDAGMYPTPPPPQTGSIGDFVWDDTNHNGIQDSGEPGIPNVVVKLYDCNTNNLLSTTATNNNGKYLFNNLSAGSYYVQFVLPNGYTFSPALQGSDRSVDSNPDPTTGKTVCVDLSAGENNLTIDAGMYPTPPPQTGSIGDFVWNDLNHNGIQNSGEPGIPNVIVKLYDCNTDALVATTSTNSNGKYLFNNLAAGSYYVWFILPSSYNFSPALQGSDRTVDSNPDVSSGKTVCIDLSAGENNLTIDAGMYIPQQNYPQLWITKDDGLVFAPDSGKTTTYTIKYGNSGSAAIYNSVVLDTLPPGMAYVSSSSGQETSQGSNIVQFNVGTLNPNDQGSVTLTAMVTNYCDNYLNLACITGKDIDNNTYEECATDLDIKDTTSNSNNGGVESRGDLSELLLKRELKIKYGMTTPIQLKKGAAAITALYTLQDFIPQTGPLNSHAVAATPFDILGISNAISSYAVNYTLALAKGNTRVGGVFSTITAAPNIYDHFKVVCDRLAGYKIDEIKLLNINGYQFYAAKESHQKDNTTDYAISFSVYETPGGYFVQNKWTYEEYKAPAGASSVYNFQVWSDSYTGTVNLVQEMLSKFSSLNKLNYMNTSQLNPDVYISSAYYSLDGYIHLAVVNNGSPKDLNFTTYYRISQGADQLSTKSSFHVNKGTNDVTINPGIISDANVYMSQASGFTDEVYVGGGAYSYINGPLSTFDSFNTSNFPQQTVTNYPEGSVVLSGGVSASGQLKDWASIVRSLSAGNEPYDLSNFNKVKFDASGNGTVEVIINTSEINNYNYFAYKISLTGESKEYTINFSQFKQLYGSQVNFDPSQIEFIGFIFSTDDNPGLSTFNITVQNISFQGNSITGVNDVNSVPHEFKLGQNYPNPFNPSTVIQFSVPASGKYVLKVYNLLGQEVAKLLNGELNPGSYNLTFDASKLSSGIYIYSLSNGKEQITKKMILMK